MLTLNSPFAEFDLQLTKDGKLIVFHDKTLDRVMDLSNAHQLNNKHINQIEYDEIKDLNFKQSF